MTFDVWIEGSAHATYLHISSHAFFMTYTLHVHARGIIIATLKLLIGWNQECISNILLMKPNRNIFLVFNIHVPLFKVIRRAFLEWNMTYLHKAQGSGGGNAVVTFRYCNIDNRSLTFILNQGASSPTVTFLIPLADLDLMSRRCCSSSLSWWWWDRRMTGWVADGHPRRYTHTLKPRITITARRDRRLTKSDLSM